MSKQNKLLFSSFTLRVIAILAVLSDHIAYAFVSPTTTAYTLMRIFGRLAFPLFAFLVVEAVMHTRKKDKYLLRLLYLYIVMQILIVGVYVYDASFAFQNIFATLGASAALLVYLEKKEWKKVYYLIPYALLLVFNITTEYTKNTTFDTFAGDYGIYGMVLILMFYIARKFITLLIERYPNIDEDMMQNTMRDQTLYNSGAALALVFVTFTWYVLDVYSLSAHDTNIQSYALLLIPFFMLYNGRLGYTSRAWRTFYYLFFPIHIILLAIISYLM